MNAPHIINEQSYLKNDAKQSKDECCVTFVILSTTSKKVGYKWLAPPYIVEIILNNND